MRCACWLLCLLSFATGCTSTVAERARAYKDDAAEQVAIGRYADARDSFEAALHLEPQDVGLIYNIGYCSDRIGDSVKATQYYNECLRVESSNPTYRHALAALYMRQGQREQAIRVIQDWLAQEPQNCEAFVEDAWLWHELGDTSRALGRLQQAVELDPNCARALVGLGMLYEEMNHPERALQLYQRALQINPNQPDIAQRLAALQAHPQPAAAAP